MALQQGHFQTGRHVFYPARRQTGLASYVRTRHTALFISYPGEVPKVQEPEILSRNRVPKNHKRFWAKSGGKQLPAPVGCRDQVLSLPQEEGLGAVAGLCG